MIPRRDPETAPVILAIQLIKCCTQDQYGTDRKAVNRFDRVRPKQTRNSVPVRLYRYRGTGECMTETEAAYWLRMNVAPGRPLNPHPGATLPKGSPPR
jgi:hypothetical protein